MWIKAQTREEIVNLTPHEITIVNEAGEVIERIPASGTVARLKTETVREKQLGKIPLSYTKFGEVEKLPEQQPGIYYVVSQLIKSALPGRKDLLVPAEMVRDEKGNITGARSLGI